MRIVLNTSPELDKALIAFAKKLGMPVNKMLNDDAESKYLQSISNDTACLNKLIADAKEYAEKNPVGTRFTVSGLHSINNTALQNEAAGKRSAQRASVTRRLISAIKSGAVPNVCCLLDSNGNAVKIKRNSSFVIVDEATFQSLTSDKVIAEEELVKAALA